MHGIISYLHNLPILGRMAAWHNPWFKLGFSITSYLSLSGIRGIDIPDNLFFTLVPLGLFSLIYGYTKGTEAEDFDIDDE